MTPMNKKKTPQGWPRISSALYHQDPDQAIDWWFLPRSRDPS